MSRLLMNLRQVPDDEAEAVRDLLDANAVDWYEIAPNRWGVSPGAIWVRDDDEHPRAKALLDAFQRQRAQTARADYAADRQHGRAGIVDVVRREPLRVAVALLCVALMLGLAALPVFLLGN